MRRRLLSYCGIVSCHSRKSNAKKCTKSKNKENSADVNPTNQIQSNHPLKSDTFPLSPPKLPVQSTRSETQSSQTTPLSSKSGAFRCSYKNSTMAIADQRTQSDNKVWGFFKLSFRQSGPNTTSSNAHVEGSNPHGSNSVSSVARSLLPTRRRLRLDPANKLYFPYEPGKQARSAIRIKNTTKSYVAFKFQTTAPKSCFMRPPGAILAPGESLIATVFKFVEHPENNEKPMDQKSKVKFKIVSLKVKGAMDYVPELFDEQKDQVVIEQILRVIFLDPERPCPALDKLKRQLADAEAALETRKKPPEDAGPKIIGEGLVIDEWKERRERYLARQQVEGVDSV